jgi:hypothetical protein
MSDAKGEYIVETIGLPLPTEPLTPGKPVMRTDPLWLPKVCPTMEQALDEAGRRINAGQKVQIVCPDGCLIRHSEVLSRLSK